MNPQNRAESAKPGDLRVAVVQDGARLHYAVPQALQRAGALDVMFSEWFVRAGMGGDVLRRLLGSRGRRWLERRCDEIPGGRVRTNALLFLRQRRRRRSFTSDEAFYAWASTAVGEWIRSKGLGGANALFGFIRNIDPALCRWAREQGITVVGDQIIAPATIESQEADIQIQRWPGWEPAGARHEWLIVEDVERETWASVDHISCASEYVRDGLRRQGIAAEKISVAPYPIDAAKYLAARHSGGPLTVGFVGAVNLRKGAPYFCQIARRLASPALRFVMVGPVQLNEKVVSDYAGVVQFVGRVSRSEVGQWMNKFDLYLFPSTCEGSAGSAMEAMACGLPVIASPNAGTIVRHEIDGFIHPYDAIDDLCASVSRLAGDASLRGEMSRQARASAERMNLEHYGAQLLEIFRSAALRR